MSRQQQEFSHSSNWTTSANSNRVHSVQKPIEMYVFLDPFSLDSWSLQAYLKKLTMEYGRFFTMRSIVSGSFCLSEGNPTPKTKSSQVSCIFKNKNKLPTNQPLITYFAIKAAELQGKKAGNRFLRSIQEKSLLKKLDISSEETLLQCAAEANLDMQEFERDFFSSSTKKAYQCDRRLTQEMDVQIMPTIVFFNQTSEGHGIKVSGIYPYDVYELILSDILTYQPIPSEKLSLEAFIREHSIVDIKEVSTIYDWSPKKAEKELKKLQFKQKVEPYVTDYGTFWKATN